MVKLSTDKHINTMSEVKATYPAGKYYIGDICYALDSKTYHQQWGKLYHYDKGTFQVQYKNIVKTFSVNHTKFGDGVFMDTANQLRFLVDSGTIGIIPIDLCDTKKIENDMMQGGHIIESKTSVDFRSNEGVFVIEYNNNNKMIIIDTDTTEDEIDSDNNKDDVEVKKEKKSLLKRFLTTCILSYG